MTSLIKHLPSMFNTNDVLAEKATPVRVAPIRFPEAVLAYASDYGLLPTALQPHGVPFRAKGLQIASLDHSVWMHRAFRADEWLRHVVVGPNGRDLTSTFNCVEVEFPAERIREYLADRLGRKPGQTTLSQA